MSKYLSKKIKNIIDNISDSETPKDKLQHLKKEIEKDLKCLSDNQNLRVCSNKKAGWKKNDGGCLLPCRKNRTPTGNLSCSNNAKPEEEVVFERAIFNSGELSGYELLTYEAPFFRHGKNNKGSEISTSSVKCDLVGLKKKEFCCIELKTNPNSPVTQIPYALLEAFSYWICATWIYENRKKDLSVEIAHANSQRPSALEPINDIQIEKISFAVAVTEKYIRDYNTGDLPLIQILEKAIENICPNHFSGYWILSPEHPKTPIEKTDAPAQGTAKRPHREHTQATPERARPE